jgi:copper chaperone NosL
MSRPRAVAVVALLVSLAACQARDVGPASLTPDTTCAYCRMRVSDPRLASEVLIPGEEPRFFDDLGCLTKFLVDSPGLAQSARIYVADHRTGAWTPADRAVYTRTASVIAPMGSPLIAHASAVSRDADPAAVGGTDVVVREVLAR